MLGANAIDHKPHPHFRKDFLKDSVAGRIERNMSTKPVADRTCWTRTPKFSSNHSPPVTRHFGVTLIVLALTASQSLAQSFYEPYTFTTLAGYSSYGSADGAGSEARFNTPLGVAVDNAGNVYVAD